MIVPNLPTDNLYKFIALSGLVLTLFCGAFTIQRTEALGNSVYKNSIEFSEWKIKNDFLSKQIIGVEKELTALEQKENPTKEEVEKLRKKHEQNKTKLLENEILKEKVRLANEYSNSQSSQLKKYYFWGSITSFFSLVFSAFGFSSWYFKVQRYQDKILRNKSQT